MEPEELVEKHNDQLEELTKKLVNMIPLSKRTYRQEEMEEKREKLGKEMSSLYVLGYRHGLETVQNKVEENRKANQQ